jgi:type I restriction enzyme S subunit
MSSGNKRKITEIVDFNPSRKIRRDSIAPFIDMASLPIDGRDVNQVLYKEFSGGGAKFKNGDTLFARITPCLENGKTAKVSSLLSEAVGHGSTEFIVMAAKEPEYDEEFVYYIARLPEFRSYATARMEGTSGRQRVPWQALAEFEYPFPEKEDRQHIGRVLKSLDDKIENNRRMNETLEGMAQAIFKSWFVDFDPVRAKVEVLENGGSIDAARLAAMQAISGKSTEDLQTLKTENPDIYADLASTADAFPSFFTPSPLGDIPDGWEVKKIDECYNVIMGQSPSGDTYNENKDGTLFYQGRAEFGWRFPSPRMHTTAPKRMATAGDILLSVRAPVGDMNIALDDCCIGRGLSALKHRNESTTYSYYQINSIKGELDRFNGSGTVFGSINQKDLKNISILEPSKPLQEQFILKCSDLDRMIENSSFEILSLTEIRDGLLPKLLSGELQIEGKFNFLKETV